MKKCKWCKIALDMIGDGNGLYPWNEEECFQCRQEIYWLTKQAEQEFKN